MPNLTRFEVTRLISARALQISLGAPALVKAHKGDVPLDIARLEFEKRVIPLAVLREFPDGHVEKIDVN
ncbi:MAG: DNA-directed RNA polymerase subunit K [Candidatus Diapherotrites archaeon]|uniref:DNA-directed RNA polymerase subunit K n=1 Tax=Candidatus Iainarchaeum sp. TaxID=3101447 RepID=A0A8T3YKD5_9ARCH|nr:DNA-directed RNA polymerase subunit K [Candidatus Diapherotrites archaeon]